MTDIPEDLSWIAAVDAHKAKRYDDAKEGYSNALKADPENLRALYLLGVLHRDQGNTAEALYWLRKCVGYSPDWVQPILDIAEIHLERENVDAAIAMVNRIPSETRAARAFRTVALILEKNNKKNEAVRTAWMATQCNDSSSIDWIELAELQRRMGNYALSIEAYKKANKLDPSNSSISINIAGLHQVCGKYTEAIHWYDLCEGSPEYNATLFQYAECLKKAMMIPRWIKAVEKLVLFSPNQMTTVSLAQELARFYGLMPASFEADKIVGELDDWCSMVYTFLFLDLSRDQRIALAARAPFLECPPIFPNHRKLAAVGSKLRVGYLGSDFYDHVMGKMVAQVLSSVEKSTQSVICYSLGSVEDTTTALIARSADVFLRCGHLSDEALAQKIGTDNLDILIDLSGPTAGSRPGVLARKPAPVIITHVGAAGPIGLSAVDYKLTDAICDLPENQEYLIEKLLPMDGCCYPVPKYPLPTQGVTKADLNLETSVTIGAFYTYMKLSERCVKLWKRVLDEIPNGVLLFSPLDPKLQIAYENIMRSAEIPSSRFRFLTAGATEAERLSRYRVVDFVLDSMPYGGVNGTLEALYMGVPVVTLTGKHHSERTTTSMLTHLGVTDTIAATPEEYIAYAKRLATDRAWRDDVSTRIRARWPKFADPVDYARRWEALLRRVAK
jgi:protein O-GlcNAc transferase